MDVDPEVKDDGHHHKHLQGNQLKNQAHEERGNSAHTLDSSYLKGQRARHPPPFKTSLNHARDAVNQGWAQVSLDFFLIVC
jgi:hypothetical protein